jgi:hypothetical protein
MVLRAALDFWEEVSWLSREPNSGLLSRGLVIVPTRLSRWLIISNVSAGNIALYLGQYVDRELRVERASNRQKILSN